MRLLCVITIFTVSRRSADSSPKMMRPAQSTITMSSLVRTVSFSCMEAPFGRKSKQEAYSGECLFCKDFVGQSAFEPRFTRCPDEASGATLGVAEVLSSRIIELSPIMSYQVLARKYRPQKFAEVIGQEHVTRTLQNAIAQERIAHGYIFSGHRGIGKTTVARILAMSLNCRSSSDNN